MKLFCFPYAGGMPAMIYSRWTRILATSIEVIPVDMPGREKFPCPGAFENIDEAVDKILNRDLHTFQGTYAFWGHSLGAIVAFELAKRINDMDMVKPRCLFLTGKSPVHIPEQIKPVHTLDDESFINEVYEMNGTQEGALDNEEIRGLFLPILRKDFGLVYDYTYQHVQKKLDVPMIVMSGMVEDINYDLQLKWSELTSKSVDILQMAGDHFFIYDNVELIADIIRETLVTD